MNTSRPIPQTQEERPPHEVSLPQSQSVDTENKIDSASLSFFLSPTFRFMDSGIERLPPSYFSIDKSTLPKRSRNQRKGYRKRSYRLHHGSNEGTTPLEWALITLMATFVLGVAIAILVYLLRGRINTVTTVVCPSDYYGTNCERDDFLDVITWSSMSEMKLADGSCFSGCSFRTWAPGASMVRLLFFLYSSFSPSYYTMR